MTYFLRALNDRPYGLWRLDDSSPHNDISGYGLDATGTAGTGMPIVGDATQSARVSSANIITFPFNLFAKGCESHAFSLEAKILPIAKGVDAPIQILGHTGLEDGLVLDSTTLSFVMKYETAPDFVVSYDLGVLQNCHVAAVYEREFVTLYVNGEDVVREQLDPSQIADSFVNTSTGLVSGESTGGREILLNGVAFYTYALSALEVLEHSEAANNESTDVEPGYYGEEINFNRDSLELLFEQEFSSAGDWLVGELIDVAIDDDALIPQSVDGVSIPGTWRTAVYLYDGDTALPVNGSTIRWEGSGAIVRTSVDGTNWVVAQNNESIATLPAGFDPTGTELLVEVEFPGGITNDSSSIKNLRVMGFKSLTAAINDHVSIIHSGGTSVLDYQIPVSFRDDWGVIYSSGDFGKITADTSPDPVQPKTIELWVKILGSSDTYVFDARSGAGSQPYYVAGTTSTFGNTTGQYVNGLPVASNYRVPANEWVVLHVKTNAAVTTDIRINSDRDETTKAGVQIGKVVFYESELTDSQINHLVKSYFGRIPYKITDQIRLVSQSAADSYGIYTDEGVE